MCPIWGGGPFKNCAHSRCDAYHLHDQIRKHAWKSWKLLPASTRKLDFLALMIHTIRKVKFFIQNSILTNAQHFHEFFIHFFLTIFLVKSKLSTAKKSKTTTFSRVFHPKQFDNFLGKSKLNFCTKNEDFEQCDEKLALEKYIAVCL